MSHLRFQWLFDENEEEEATRSSRRRTEEIPGHAQERRGGITSIEGLEELVNYCFDREKYDDALQFVNRLLPRPLPALDNWRRKGLILSNLLRHERRPPGLDRALHLNPVDPGESLINKGITLTTWTDGGGDRMLRAGAGQSTLATGSPLPKGISLEKTGPVRRGVPQFSGSWWMATRTTKMRGTSWAIASTTSTGARFPPVLRRTPHHRPEQLQRLVQPRQSF